MGSRIVTAFTGIATRRMVADYLRMVALIMLILLAIAWTIDLAKNFNIISSRAENDEVSVISLLVPYLTYRSADIITRMLPMACFFGVFLAEFLRRTRLETVILATSGATPLRLLSGIVIVGATLGALQHQLEERWRPAAVAAQVELGIGGYAARFGRWWIEPHAWFVMGDTAVRAQVLRDDPPAMRDALIFTGIREQRLEKIFAADHIEPGAGRFEWKLTGVATWDASAGRDTSEPEPDQTMILDLIPEQLTFLNIPAFYLPSDPIYEIAKMESAPASAVDARVAIWRRRTAFILPGALSLLAVVLCQRGFSGRQADIPRLLALAFFGYASVVSIKVLWAVGELGGLTPAIAVLASILFILGTGLWLWARQL